MQIHDILVMDEEDEIRKLNIPSATIRWSGPFSFKEASSSPGGGLYVIVKNGNTPIYVGQTGRFKSRFHGRLYILRQAACNLRRRQVYLGSITLPRGWKKSRRNLRLDLESVLIRSYRRSKQKLVNRSSIREFMMGPKDAVIKNKGTLPPKMKRTINVKRNEAFELDVINQKRGVFADAFNESEQFDSEELEVRGRRRPRRSIKPIGKRLVKQSRSRIGRPRPRRSRARRKVIRARPRRPFIRRSRSILPNEPCICPPQRTEFVRWVQSSLNQIMGLRLRINGVMNRATRDALRDFQKQEGMHVDGIAGPETEKNLIKAKVRN